MSNVILKNQPKITLELLIKRRRTTLSKFLNEAGVQSFAGLLELCKRMGVACIDERTYERVAGTRLVTSQEDGIVVIGPAEEIEQDDVQNVKKTKKSRKKEDKETEQVNDTTKQTDSFKL